MKRVSVFDLNITHNLAEMAQEAGVYKALWRPEDIGAKYARDLIEPLKIGLMLLKKDPKHFEKYNPVNGWGEYTHLLWFVENYLKACKGYPEAEIEVSR
jgi:hypothetical protein